MAHDLIGEDPHLIRMSRQDVVCMCWGSCCYKENRECICPECDCQEMEARQARERKGILEAQAKIVELRLPAFDHACGDCGVEVFRNGTRGRFPSRCPACKDKQ